MTKPTNTSTDLLLIISGPSGVGKTTITRHLEQELGGVFSVSVTTRPKSAADMQGVDYTFVDKAEFERRLEAGLLLEWADVFGQYYGTPREPVEAALADGQLVLLEIDVQGAVQVKRGMPQTFAIFIEPPSEQTLLDRLRGRKRDDESVIQRRFAKARDEIARARSCGVYDRIIVNDDLDTAKQDALAAVRNEVARRAAMDT